MVCIVKPEAKFVFGSLGVDLGSGLGKYSEEFVKRVNDVFVEGYDLFVRSDPSYVYVFRPKSPLSGHCAGVIGVSYDQVLTEKIVGDVVSGLDLNVFELGGGGSRFSAELKGLVEMVHDDVVLSKIKRFCELVNS